MEGECKMSQVVVVIGDRLGKGHHVAKGVEAAGGKAIVISGVGADMRLGDVMDTENADIGISFCGSGGAGAITAQTKYGYPAHYGMRSVDEGITAINEGKKYSVLVLWIQKSLARELRKPI